MDNKVEQQKSTLNCDKRNKGKGENTKISQKVKRVFVPVQKTVSIPSNSSDMVVVTKAKELVRYIFQVTANSPKKIRFSFVSRIQSITLDLIENLYRAAEIPYNSRTQSSLEKKIYFLTEAKISIKLIEYFALLMLECGFFEIRHYKQIAQMGIRCETLLNAWLKKLSN